MISDHRLWFSGDDIRERVHKVQASLWRSLISWYEIKLLYFHSRSLWLKPSAGEPAGQVSNSQGSVRTVGGALEVPVPDSFSAGADKITCKDVHALSYVVARKIGRVGTPTSKPAALNASFCARILATAQPSSFVRTIFLLKGVMICALTAKGRRMRTWSFIVGHYNLEDSPSLYTIYFMYISRILV